ncbi:MAG: aminoglycoside phosphotransferase family protein [Actinomycetota bacterium]|nr:aminoglycoside phosphotransferase family protein [Actinomycetota bacterium]
MTSPVFRANVTAVHGESGARWLADLPRLLGEIERSWDVRIGPPYELSHNYVAPVTRSSGALCVVKLTVPGSSGVEREAAALGGFAGHGAIRLLDYDDSRGALLLERAEPGRELAEFGPARDGEATTILCSVMQRLWCEAPPDLQLPGVADYGADFTDHVNRHPRNGPLPRRLVDRAAELLEQLVASATRTVLLHGDLHHHNILQSRREPWLAIDPHGLIGDPGFEVGAMLYNPVTFDAEQLVGLLPSRLEQLCDNTGLETDRVLAWGFVMAVLSEVWSAQDRDEIDGRPLAIAEVMAAQLH